MHGDKFTTPYKRNRERVLSELSVLSTEVTELAAISLEDAEISVSASNISPSHKPLPKEFIELFQAIGKPANFAVTAKTEFSFTKEARNFSKLHAQILVDNDASLDFTQSRRADEQDQFFFQILDEARMPLLLPGDKDIVKLLSYEELAIIFASMELPFPTKDENEGWNPIGSIMSRANHWRATSKKTLYLSPQRQVRIIETVSSGTYDTKRAIGQTAIEHANNDVLVSDDFDTEGDDASDQIDGLLYPREAWHKTIVVCIDSLSKKHLLPTSSLQLTLTSDDPFEPVRYEGISRVPIERSDHNTTQDVEEERKNVKPSLKLLDHIRNEVLEARLSVS